MTADRTALDAFKAELADQLAAAAMRFASEVVEHMPDEFRNTSCEFVLRDNLLWVRDSHGDSWTLAGADAERGVILVHDAHDGAHVTKFVRGVATSHRERVSW